MTKICIDPGHGGLDSGAVGPTGLRESEVAWRISSMVADLLLRHDIEVIFTREGDTRVSLDKRVQIANSSNVDYFVSIHLNSAKNPKATGTEVYAYNKASEGNVLAQHILDSLVDSIKLPNRGIKYDRLQVVATTKMPAVLVEVAFINNIEEEKLLKDDDFIENAAVGIARGILKHLGISYMQEDIKETDWREMQGMKHLVSLKKKGIIHNPETWIDKMLEPMPVWAILSLIDRVSDR